MTDSVKFLSASYGAEYAKGPAVLQAFSKSGGQKFHGEGYIYARNSAVGYANDWFNKASLASHCRFRATTTSAATSAVRCSFHISTTTATSCSSGPAMSI